MCPQELQFDPFGLSCVVDSTGTVLIPMPHSLDHVTALTLHGVGAVFAFKSPPGDIIPG